MRISDWSSDVCSSDLSFDIRAQDPQGLTAEQARTNPRSSSVGALNFDTRKTVRQRQAGLRIEQPLDGHGRVEVGLHAGTRDTWQMLSVPVFAQVAPGSGGGVIALEIGRAACRERVGQYV